MATTPDSLTGHTLGGFELQERLPGGAAAFYRATDRSNNQSRTVAVLPAELARDTSSMARFRREALVAAALDHPNIPRIHDVGTADGHPYVVMDLVTGRSLRELLRDTPLPPERAAHILEQLGSAVDYAHAQGVAHGDLSPDNVVVNQDDRVMLLGFALAANGERDAGSSDRHGLGLLAYEMLTGQTPALSATNDTGATGVPRRTSSAALAPELERVVRRQMSSDSADRFETGTSFASALTGAARNAPRQPAPPRHSPSETPERRGSASAASDRSPASETRSAKAPTTPTPGQPRQSAGPARKRAAPKRSSAMLPQIAGVAVVAILAALGAILYLRVVDPQPGPRPTSPQERAAAGSILTPSTILDPAATPSGSASSRRQLQLVWMAIDSKDFPRAFGILDQLRATDPNAPGLDEARFQAHLKYGETLLESNNLDRSDAEFVEALKLKPDDPSAREGRRQVMLAGHWNRMVAARGRDDDEAISALETIMQLDPEFRQTRQVLTTLLLARAERQIGAGDGPGAHATLLRAAEVSPNDPTVRQRLAAYIISPTTAERVTSVARLGRGRVTQVAYAKDGRFLAVGTSIGIFLYEPATLNELRFIDTGALVSSLAIAPDSQVMAAGGSDGTIRIWRTGDGTAVLTMQGHSGQVNGLAFSGDGQTLVSGSADRTIRHWRVADGVTLRTFDGHSEAVNGVALTSDGQILASASADGQARLWRTADGETLQTLGGHDGPVNSVAFSPDNQTVVTGANDRAIRRWRVEDGGLMQKIDGHTGEVTTVTYSPDGRTLVSGSRDGTVRTWQADDGVASRTFAGHSNWINGVSFAADGQTLASSSWDGTVKLWGVADGAVLRTIERHTSTIQGIAISPDRRLVAVGSRSLVPQLWQLSDGAAVGWMVGHLDVINAVTFSPDGQMVATASGDDTARLWWVRDGSLIHVLEGHTAGVTSVAFAPDGQTLATGGEDNTVRLWRVSDGAAIRTLTGHNGWVTSVAFSPNGQTLASGSADRTARLWSVADGSVIHTLQGHDDWVTGLAFSPDGQSVATSSEDVTARLWQVSDGSLIRQVAVHGYWITSLAFSPDGQTLVTGAGDRTVRLWRIEDGSMLRTLEGHTDWVRSVAFTPDGQTIVSAGDDGTVRLWAVR